MLREGGAHTKKLLQKKAQATKSRENAIVPVTRRQIFYRMYIPSLEK